MNLQNSHLYILLAIAVLVIIVLAARRENLDASVLAALDDKTPATRGNISWMAKYISDCASKSNTYDDFRKCFIPHTN